MAKKQQAPPSQPPQSSSSSSSGEEESSSSSDEEQTNYSSIPHPKKLPIQNQKPESEEESSDDDEDEDENPQPVKKPTSNSTPHPKKSLIQSKKSENEEESSDGEEESSDGEEDEDENPQPVKKPTPSTPEPKSEKKMLTPSKPSIPNKSNGKSPIVRIWSVDDEITILQAMMDHQSKNGRIELNAAGVKDLHDSIRKSLSICVDTAKLTEKIRRIRKKYVNAKKKGAELKFSKAHDKTIYDLSEKVWGKKEEEEEDGFVVKGNSHGATVNKGRSLKRAFPFIMDAFGGNRLALEMLETVDVKKAMALEENFKKLKAAEINLTGEVYKLLR